MKNETVNFCELSDDKLIKLLDFLGENEIVEKSEMMKVLIGDKCVEKRWDWYTKLVVYPQEIRSTGVVTVVLMTSEKFLKMKEIFS